MSVNRSVLVRTSGVGSKRGRPFSPKAEEFAKAIMGIGITDGQSEKVFQLVHSMLLEKEEDKCSHTESSTPSEKWFGKRRTRGGLEATCYVWLNVLKASSILQMGFDETKIAGKAHLDLWAVLQIPIRSDEFEQRVVTLSGGTILIDSSAEGTSSTVFKIFERGARLLNALKSFCGGTFDNLIQDNVTGAQLFIKVKCLMHDTCHTALSTANKLKELKKKLGQQLYGIEAWNDLSPSERDILDTYCSNHGRNLQITVILI